MQSYSYFIKTTCNFHLTFQINVAIASLISFSQNYSSLKIFLYRTNEEWQSHSFTIIWIKKKNKIKFENTLIIKSFYQFFFLTFNSINFITCKEFQYKRNIQKKEVTYFRKDFSPWNQTFQL